MNEWIVVWNNYWCATLPQMREFIAEDHQKTRHLNGAYSLTEERVDKMFASP